MHATRADAGHDDDLEAWFQAVVARVDGRFPLTIVPVDPALAEPKSFLKILKARHLNWTAERYRKIFGMRFNVRIPALDQMNFIMYPEPAWDTPIFLFFCLLTARKVICHVNVNLVRSDPAYAGHWVDPLVAVRSRHGSFDCEDRYPGWMQKWRTPAGIYGMFPRERCPDFMVCGMEYLDIYLDLARQAQPVDDPGTLAEVAGSHARFVNDIRTQDKAQAMMAKMIGSATARRIFHEVTT